MSLALYCNTIRYLRPRQIVGQLRRHILGSSMSQHLSGRDNPDSCPGVVWNPSGDFISLPSHGNSNAQLKNGSFSFLNESHNLGWPPVWSCAEPSKLWQYNLHYFDYIWLLEFEDAQRVVTDWIVKYPPGTGHIGWDPYPLSLRATNWCTYFLGKYRERTLDDVPFANVLWDALRRQMNWLASNVEGHLLGNHLLENAVALAVCGACFDGSEASTWLAQGVELLREQVPEQILKDGGHFERSPMYQKRVIAALDSVSKTGNDVLRDIVDKPLQLARVALGNMCHPDGEIALLNDSALNVYPAVSMLVANDVCKRTACFSLPEMGYYGATSEAGHYILCDAAPVGPDYLPGHAHGDIFSFELSLNGHRVIVDSGTFDYEESEMRAFCRSTRAHNTVELNEQDQCEFWKIFRVGRRGRPRDVVWSERENGFELDGRHDGYRRLPGKPVHSRHFEWSHDGVLCVTDRITSSRKVGAISRLHFHPDCQIETINKASAVVSYPGGSLSISFEGDGILNVEDGFYCPEFGVKLANKVMAFKLTCAKDAFGFTLTPGT